MSKLICAITYLSVFLLTAAFFGFVWSARGDSSATVSGLDFGVINGSTPSVSTLRIHNKGLEGIQYSLVGNCSCLRFSSYEGLLGPMQAVDIDAKLVVASGYGSQVSAQVFLKDRYGQKVVRCVPKYRMINLLADDFDGVVFSVFPGRRVEIAKQVSMTEKVKNVKVVSFPSVFSLNLSLSEEGRNLTIDGHIPSQQFSGKFSDDLIIDCETVDGPVVRINLPVVLYVDNPFSLQGNFVTCQNGEAQAALELINGPELWEFRDLEVLKEDSLLNFTWQQLALNRISASIQLATSSEEYGFLQLNVRAKRLSDGFLFDAPALVPYFVSNVKKGIGK